MWSRKDETKHILLFTKARPNRRKNTLAAWRSQFRKKGNSTFFCSTLVELVFAKRSGRSAGQNCVKDSVLGFPADRRLPGSIVPKVSSNFPASEETFRMRKPRGARLNRSG